MKHHLIYVGFDNFVAAGRILSVASTESAPAKRDMIKLRENGCLKDFTRGRKGRALIYLDTGLAIVSSMLPETIANRFAGKKGIVSDPLGE